RLARNLLGWLEGVGTGWFVTLAIEFAILMPLLVLCVRRLGPRRAVALSVLVTAACFALRFPLVGRLGTFGWFVFPPRLLANVVFGIVLAPVVDRLGAREMLVAAIACVGYFALPAVLGAASPWQPVPEGIGLSSSGASAAAYRLLDLPVSVLLLGASGVLAAVPVLGAALDWLGVRSYGVYLGQMVAHNAVALLVGTEAFRARFGPPLLVAVLLAGALAWIAVTDRAAAILV
ncbi:MAG: acyltransferase family protein, partial [Alphaproteobacteria bacterium]